MRVIELSVCDDCLVGMANGEVLEVGPDGYFDKMPLLREVWRVNGYDEGSLVPACDGEECGFSRTRCDTCSSSLAGTRHKAALLGES